MDDWEWYDNDGDDCDYYYANPEQCGNYGEGAWDACCACGGSGSDDMDWDREDEWDGCESDFSWVDDGGDNCDWYESNDQSCGSYGEGAWEACCACGGGNWGWEDDWSDDDGEPIDWEWYVDEASDMLPQDGDVWTLGPVTVTYNDAATKIASTIAAAALAITLV